MTDVPATPWIPASERSLEDITKELQDEINKQYQTTPETPAPEAPTTYQIPEKKWVVDKAAWTETINHPAETHTETVHHDEVGHWE